ncbi:MAG: transglutaminase-like domain-containing protein [Bacillota bacterium]
MSRASRLIPVLACVWFFAVQADELSFYRLLEPKAYVIRNTYVLKNKSKISMTRIKADVVLGAKADSPYQQNLSYQSQPSSRYTSSDAYGNIIGRVEIDELKPGAQKKITLEYRIKNSGIEYDSLIYALMPSYDYFISRKENLQYLNPDVKIESDAVEIWGKAQEFDPAKTPAERAKAIYDFVNLNLKYDTNPACAHQGALNAIRTGRGVCEEFAALFVALCRAAGIPARVVTGYWIKEKLKPGVWYDIRSKGHAWAEFYLPEAGWVPVEPSFVYICNGERKPHPDYFAHISPESRHFIYSYMLGDAVSSINIKYSYTVKSSKKSDTSNQPVLDLEKAEEKIMLIDAGDEGGFLGAGIGERQIR